VGFRLAARLARREIFRRPGRTFLVALLVALPVAGMTVAAVMVRTQHETPLQRWQQQYGRADASVTSAHPLVPGRGILAQLPEATTADGMNYVETRLVRTARGRLSMPTISTLAASDPVTQGILQIMSGRAPTTTGEVFLTRDAAHQLGVAPGDTLHLVRPARRSFKVTGVGELAAQWGQVGMVLPSGAPYPWKSSNIYPSVSTLINFASPPSSALLQRILVSPVAKATGLTISPALVAPQFDSNATDAAKKVRWSWVFGALALTVVGIVIAAAFAVGARRQLVTLGQLSGNGAPPKVLRRVLYLQGTGTGVVGALLGVGLGALTLALLAPHADQLFQRDVHPYIVRPVDVVPIVLLGVVTATVAALVPARAAGRVPVLAALAGRRPLGRVPRWIPATGALVATGGLALLGLAVINGRNADGAGSHSDVWLLTAIVGGVCVLLGACAIAPLYVSMLEPAATRTRGSWRVATRSLARQRTRTSAVVSAIAATGALVIAASSLLLAAHNHDTSRSQSQPGTVRANEVQLSGHGTRVGSNPPPATFAAAVAKVLPHSNRFQLQIPFRPNASWEFTGFRSDHPTAADVVVLDSGGVIYGTRHANAGNSAPVGIADRAFIAEYGLSTSDQHELARSGALVLANTRGRATLELVTHGAPHLAAPRPQALDAVMVDARQYRTGQLPSVFVTPAKAAQLGMTVKPSTVVLRAKHALTTDQRNRISNIAITAAQAVPNQQNPGINFEFYIPPTARVPLRLEWLLVGVALVVTLLVVAVNLALSATETRDERDVLIIVGAPPGVMSRTNGYKATLLTVMGVILAIPVGLLPVAVFVAASHKGLHFAFPASVVALLVIALPLVAGLVTTGASRLALRVRPVHISTMAFD
jgi:ABC-type lipoprotein release transport system permease subunit